MIGDVEFKDESSVFKAIEMTGQKIKGVPVIAFVQLTVNAATNGGDGAPLHRLYVGKIHFSASEEDLDEILAPGDRLESLNM